MHDSLSSQHLLPNQKQLVFTVKERCRKCYTCVRECPAKAIRIANGQAEIIASRCIGCGNCVKVCSQEAKVFVNDIEKVKEIIATGKPVVAMVAPSFPAEFTEISTGQLVGAIRKLGFYKVTEVSFGADLVAREYKQQLSEHSQAISSDCPAIVSYIERYYPKLANQLSTVVSPMVAMTRVVHDMYGAEVATVFMGPCLAKKAESEEVDAALTFRELRQMLSDAGIHLQRAQSTEFDPPLGGKGAIFPLSHGLLNSIDLNEDLLTENVLVAGGRANFQDALREYENGTLAGHHLHLLCCEGCILGPGMSPLNSASGGGQKFVRKSKVINYANTKMATLDRSDWKQNLDKYATLDLSCSFEPHDMRIKRPPEEQIKEMLLQMGKYSAMDHLNCGTCGYDTCEEHAIAVINGLAESEMCLPYSIDQLHNYIKQLDLSNEKLASVQEALHQSEKLAGMGQLSAGIAHELNNPLGVITMYSNILKEELPDGHPMKADLDLITEQADRCRKIVGGLLNFARKNQVNLVEASLRKLIEHSINAVIVPEHITIKTLLDATNDTLAVDYDQMTQVIANLLKNAIDAMPAGGEIVIEASIQPEKTLISIKDQGCGIPPENMGKLFTPFFTTKAPGKGTGLGLPIIYGIVKMHKGDISIESNTDPTKGATGTTFRLSIPRKHLV